MIKWEKEKAPAVSSIDPVQSSHSHKRPVENSGKLDVQVTSIIVWARSCLNLGYKVLRCYIVYFIGVLYGNIWIVIIKQSIEVSGTLRDKFIKYN